MEVIQVQRIERFALVVVVLLGVAFGGMLIGHSLWNTHGGISAYQHKIDQRTIAGLIRLTNSDTKLIDQLSAKLLATECSSQTVAMTNSWQSASPAKILAIRAGFTRPIPAVNQDRSLVEVLVKVRNTGCQAFVQAPLVGYDEMSIGTAFSIFKTEPAVRSTRSLSYKYLGKGVYTWETRLAPGHIRTVRFYLNNGYASHCAGLTNGYPTHCSLVGS